MEISMIMGLSEADKEALAIMAFTKKDLVFCTGDKKIIRSLVTLDIKEKSLSFEKVLKMCGLKCSIPYERSEKYFKKWLGQGAIDFISRGKPKK
jgi:hypothetical protein